MLSGVFSSCDALETNRFLERIERFELFGHSVKRRRKLCKFIFAADVYARGEIAATHLRDAFAQLADWAS